MRHRSFGRFSSNYDFIPGLYMFIFFDLQIIKAKTQDVFQGVFEGFFGSSVKIPHKPESHDFRSGSRYFSTGLRYVIHRSHSNAVFAIVPA